MLKIRLQRTGRANDPAYRLIVVEHTESPKTGNVVEQVGTYNPKTKAKNFLAERIKYWLSVGAKASGTVHNMLVSAGIVEGKKVNVLPKKSPPKSESSEQRTENPEAQRAGNGAGSEQPAAETATPQETPQEEAAAKGEAVAAETKTE